MPEFYFAAYKGEVQGDLAVEDHSDIVSLCQRMLREKFDHFQYVAAIQPAVGNLVHQRADDKNSTPVFIERLHIQG